MYADFSASEAIANIFEKYQRHLNNFGTTQNCKSNAIKKSIFLELQALTSLKYARHESNKSQPTLHVYILKFILTF